MAVAQAKVIKGSPAVVLRRPHLHDLGLCNDLAIDVIEVVWLNPDIDLQIILANLVLDLGLSQQQVLLHVLKSFESQVHVDGGDTLAPVLLRVEDQVLFYLELVNGLPPVLSGLVLYELPINVEFEAAQF